MSGQLKTRFLIEHLADRVARPVSPLARERASLHLIDWVGCALAGRAAPAARILREEHDPGPSGLAFAWGGLGNILEMDDVDKRATLHPGPSIIPAVLALARHIQAPADDILDAIVAGYEATIRLGRAAGTGHYAFWHSTATCGPIGAAAACGRLLGLGSKSMAQALALATSQSSGFWQTRHEPDSMGKQLHTAHAARAGLDSARLAALGFQGPLSVLEGPQGFFAATCPQSDPSDVLADYEHAWLIEEVSFKPWPACRHTHAAINAALLIEAELPPIETIDTIRIRTYPDALAFCDKPAPSSTIEAKFSLQHSVAVSLMKGTPRLEDFEPAMIQNEAVRTLRGKVLVESGEPFASAYPRRFGAEVEVTASGALPFHKVRAVPDALGDPENPLTKAQIESKARALMGHAGLSPSVAEALIRSSQAPDTRFFDLLEEELG